MFVFGILQTLQTILDRGHRLPLPNAVLINGRGGNDTSFTVEQGQFLDDTYNYHHQICSWNFVSRSSVIIFHLFKFELNSSFSAGKTYRLRISNVGLQNSLNFRIQGHQMKLVEVEGTHTVQTSYDSLDIHVGQSYSVLVTADQAPQDYYIVTSTRFTSQVLTSTAVLHYSNSARQVSGPIPGGPTTQTGWSLSQARSIRYVFYYIQSNSFE